MTVSLRRLILVPMAILVMAFGNAVLAQDRYTEARASRDGIGKFYEGREISHVMGYAGMPWLERADREKEERTDLLLGNLGLEPDDVVADIGAGSGYFTIPMARMVPDGRVLAVDIQQAMLNVIDEKMVEEGLVNIETVLSPADDPRLPPGEIDLVLLVDVYHEFEYPYEMMTAIADSLAPDGRVVLIEYRGEDRRVPIKELHKMTEKQARREMELAGLEWVRTDDLLPQQHFMVFRRQQ